MKTEIIMEIMKVTIAIAIITPIGTLGTEKTVYKKKSNDFSNKNFHQTT